METTVNLNIQSTTIMVNKLLRSVLMLSVVFAFCAGSALAQSGTIEGQLTDQETGEPIIGANVFIPSLDKGAATDAKGNFTISDVPYGPYDLRISYIGYETKNISATVDQPTVTVNATLSQNISQLEDVVVTALGIERQAKSLGYSVQEVEGQELAQANETNFVTSLSGKIAGANISSSNTMGGSSRIILRGANSVSGNNQPLFVIDGVPMINSNFTSENQARGGGGYDYGNAASIINSGDVQSVSVLKGPTAAALYGSRAANGVVQITTKSGESGGRGIGVNINSGVIFSQVYELPDYQNQYGGGSAGPFAINEQGQRVVDFATDESWGPRLDGRLVRQWYSYDEVNGFLGEPTPWVAHPGNVKDFFNTGVKWNNNVSLSQGGENYSYRLSLNRMDLTGVYPESELDRKQIGFNGSLDLTEKLTTSLSVNYSYENAYARPGTGYDNENVFLQFNHFGQRQIDLGEGSYLQDIVRPDGTQRVWNWADPVAGTIRFTDNPYWVRKRNFPTDNTQRLFGNFQIAYDFTDNLSLTGSARTDYYNTRREERVAIGSQAIPQYEETIYDVQETNASMRLNYIKDLTQNFSLDAFVGGNIRYETRNDNIGTTQNGLSVPNVYTLENSIGRPSIVDYFQSQRVNSLYGNATFGYQEMFYLVGTIRNDWTSTLPEGNNSYLYPSASGSFIFTELNGFDNNVITYGKLRAGWSKVGSDTSPYRLATTYPFVTPFGDDPQLSVDNILNNPNLKPEQTYSWEFGTTLEFFDNRASLDVTYYRERTENQIISVDVSAASGYTNQILNAGTITNKGLEVGLGFTPIQLNSGFRWDIDANWSKNVSTVEELAPGLQNLRLSNAPFNVSVNARVGEAYGALIGTDFVYDENGNKVLSEGGTYLVSNEQKVLGSYVPDWQAGLSTSLFYKGFTASVSLDGQKGGSIYSLSNAFGLYSGILQGTVQGDIRETGLTPEGVLENGQEFTGRVDPETFYKSLFSIGGAYVYDASYIRLREARLAYSLPVTWFNNTPIQGLTVSAVGRNLALLFKNAPNIDPTNVVSSGNVQGLEAGQIPPQRSFGLNIQLDL